MTGYTSWYNHYQNISEQIIMENLEHVHEMGQNFDVFRLMMGIRPMWGTGWM